MGKRSTTVQGGAASTIVGRHAPLRGFSVGPPVQPTVRLGVGVVGLLPLQNAGEPAASQIVDQLSPAPTRGFFCAARCATGCCGIVSVGLPPHRQARMTDRLGPAPTRGSFVRANQLWYGVGGLPFISAIRPLGCDLAPSPWRGFCLATPAPSAGSLPMPVGWRLLTQGAAAGELFWRAGTWCDLGAGPASEPWRCRARLWGCWRVPFGTGR